MNNTERREQLARARKNAVAWSDICEKQYIQASTSLNESIAMSCMWAQVANALKKEDGEHDG